MSQITCPRNGGIRSDDLKEPCPQCGAREYIFGWYLRPKEWKSIVVAFYIVLAAVVLVLLGWAIIKLFFESQISAALMPVWTLLKS
jgi:hypothetical protein